MNDRGLQLSVAVLSSLLLVASGSAEELTLTQDGVSRCVVVTAAKPNSEESTAASWLAEYLQKVTSADVAVKTEDAGDLQAVPIKLFVGDTQAAKRHGINVANFKPEEWCVKSVEGALLLAGGKPRGTIYSVCEFLENEVGVLLLDPFSEFVPSKPTLTIASVDRRGRPAFPVRALFTGFPYAHPVNDGRLIERHRVFGKNTIWASVAAGDCTRMIPEGVHTFGHFISSKEFAKSNPEYFGMDASGKRVTDDLGTPSAWTQLCMANPDVRRIVLERSKKFLRDEIAAAKKEGREPSNILSVSQNDNTANLCLCPDCKAIADREETESGPLLEFVNHIARGVKDEFPDVVVQTEAYNFTLQAPKTIKPDPNVLVRFCDNYGFSDSTRPLTDPRNERPHRLFEEWRGKKCQLGIWDYWRVFSQHPPGMFAPNSNVRAMARDIAYFKESGVEFLTAECEDLFGAGLNNDPISADLQSFMPLRTWVGMKLLDDPSNSDERTRWLVDRFCTAYYGSAASSMRSLLELTESRQAQLTTRIVDVQRHDWAEQLCDAAFFAEAYRLLEEAMTATVQHPVEQTRVLRERIVIDSAFLWLDQHVRRQSAELAHRLPKRTDVLARHRLDWTAYLATVFNAEGLKIVTPIIENGIQLAEKLRPEDTVFRHDAIEIREPDVTLDGQLDEDFWQQAGMSRLLPRDPSQPNDNPTIVRTAWTNEALYFGIEHPAEQAPALLLVGLMAADRQGIQLDLSITRRDGPQALGGYFYTYDYANGGSLRAEKDRKAVSQSYGATLNGRTTTEVRFLWSDITETPKVRQDFLFNILTYPKPDSNLPSHTLSPWLIGTSPTWNSAYWSRLRLR